MFIRNCPECGKELSYSAKRALNRAIKKGAECRSCVRKGEKHYLYGKTLPEETLRKLSEALKGEKNPSYGKTPSEESRRKMSIGKGGNGELNKKWPGMATWANRVKERDEYICQHCNYDGLPEEMDAHHIVPKSKFPQYAYDLDNGQTLCKECHMYVHKHYG